MVDEEVLIGKGISPNAATSLAKYANHGLAQATWSSYKTVENHIDRCERETRKDLSLPFNIEKTLTFVAWLIDVRGVKSITIDKYLSGLRMIHLTKGHDIPCLREPIVKLILTVRTNWDNIKEELEGKRRRDPVTISMMKFFKKKLLTIDWTVEKKILFHAVTTLAWNGSFRIHELLSKEAKTFDPTVTLLWKDIKEGKVEIEGKFIYTLSIFLKSPKVDRIGAGQRVEVFETGNFMCPWKAFRKYKASLKVIPSSESPVFREQSGECLTGKKLNLYLDEITLELRNMGIVVKNHSFRAGVATLMAVLGYPEADIMAAGRWQSKAFLAYTKLPRLHRAKFAATLASKIMTA